ncbi:MAG: hypothetical protein ABFR36_10715, partial [Acidobacteriota bacterium]
MRKAADLFRDIKFNTITCVGNTIAHLGSPLEIRGFFESMYELLDDGGAFAGQLVNYEKVFAEKTGPFNVIENEDFKFIRKNRIKEENGKVEFSGELILKKEGASHFNRIELYPFVKDTIEKELTHIGFSSIGFFGGFDLGEYESKSDALIFKAGK